MTRYTRYTAFLALGLLACGCQKSTSTGPAAGTTHETGVGTATTPAATDSAHQKKLTVMAMDSQTVQQGETDEVMVTINRDNFDEAVAIQLEGLPAGVELVGNAPSIAAGDSSATLVIKANETAPVGDHPVRLVTKAPGLSDNVQTFTLTVNARE